MKGLHGREIKNGMVIPQFMIYNKAVDFRGQEVEGMGVRQKLLALLEEKKGEVISGEDLAEMLGCTRAAIWKAVASLREEGYPISAAPNRGYQLESASNIFSPEGIRPHLVLPDVTVEVHDTLPSTNLRARHLALEGKAGRGTVIAARRQTQGRGRRGKSFYSPEGGLYLSIVLAPDLPAGKGLLITTAAAVAVVRAVKEVCGTDLSIKWVNDLYYQDRKTGGIMTEAVTDFESGSIQFAVVGIGLNLFMDMSACPSDIRVTAGSLFESEERAAAVDKNLLTATIVNYLLEEAGRKEVSPLYIEKNIIPGHTVMITDGDQARYASAISIEPDGRLLVEEEDGSRTLLSYGEVSVRVRDTGTV